MYSDQVIAATAPPSSQATLIVQSNGFAAGDMRTQKTHIPASHSSHGLYPEKNESTKLGKKMPLRSLQQTATRAAISTSGTKLQ